MAAARRRSLSLELYSPEMKKPHDERRACTYATFLELSSLLGSNVNRVKKHRSLGEEELNRIDMHHLSQSALVTLHASDWTTLQIHYMPTLEDCKPQNRYKGRLEKKLFKPPDAIDAPDASPCPATVFSTGNSWRRVVESDGTSKKLSRINRKN